MKKRHKVVRARAPLRLGLAGGGTDVSPFCDNYGGLVVNVTIDKYAYTTIKELADPKIKFVASDLGISEQYNHSEEIDSKGKLNLIKQTYLRVIREFNNNKNISAEVITFCDAPPGSGLGSSSTLVVSLIKALVFYLDKEISKYDLARLAYEVEREDCGLVGGKQDQYSASFGGLNFLEIKKDKSVKVNEIKMEEHAILELQSSLILFFTGVSRDSETIIKDQKLNMTSNSTTSQSAFEELKNQALIMRSCLERGDLDGISESLKVGWENKKKSAKSITNPLIDEIYNKATKIGVKAGKVSGAGGGGYMMLICPPEKRMRVNKELKSYSSDVSGAYFTFRGAEAWKAS